MLFITRVEPPKKKSAFHAGCWLSSIGFQIEKPSPTILSLSSKSFFSQDNCYFHLSHFPHPFSSTLLVEKSDLETHTGLLTRSSISASIACQSPTRGILKNDRQPHVRIGFLEATIILARQLKSESPHPHTFGRAIEPLSAEGGQESAAGVRTCVCAGVVVPRMLNETPDPGRTILAPGTS